MKLEFFPFQFPVNIPTAKGRIYSRKGFYLILKNKDQSVITEVSPLPYWSSESLEEVYATIDSYQKQGLPPTHEIHFPSLQFAIEAALYRLEFFKESSFPICSYHQKNAKAMKLKLFHLPIQRAIAYCKTIKKKYPQTLLRLDVNETWSLQDAIEFTQHFSPHDFEYIEEPVSDLEELKKFIEQTHFPIALDEKLYKYSFKTLQTLPSIQALILKPTLLGGISICQNLQKIFDCPFIFSSCYETEIGLANIHLFSRLFSPKNTPIGVGTLPCLESFVPLEKEL